MSDDAAAQSRDAKLYDVAERQAGYFTTAQAKGAGFTQPQLTYHVRTGRFIRVRWGIYRLTRYPSSQHEDLYIAWLAAGPDAVVSHDSALALYDLSDALPAAIHVTVPRGASRRRRGLALHTNRVESQDIATVEGLPVTTVARTIADVAAGGLAEELVIQAAQQAVERGLVSEASLQSYAEDRGGRPSRLMRRALRERAE